MKSAAVAIATLLVIAAAPHADAAMRPSRASTPTLALRVAADSDATTARDSYTRQAMDEMREWQRKLHDASTTAAAQGKAASAAAEKDLHKAWSDAEAASHRLQVASAEGWSRARDAYERASQELTAAWQHFQSEGK